MRLSRSAERDKRNYKNSISAIYAHSNAEGIQDRPAGKKEPLHMVPCSGSFFMIAYFRLNFSGSKSGSSQKRVMISV